MAKSKNKKRKTAITAQHQQTTQVNGSSKVIVDPRKYYFEGKFYPVLLAQDILKNYLTLFVDSQKVYQYVDGVYRPDGEERFVRAATYLLDFEYKSHHVSEALTWIKSQYRIKDVDEINPDDGLINVKNGLLDWRTGRLFPHDKNRLSTIQFPVNFDPDANDQNVLEFIENVIPIDTVETVYEFIGYCLTTHTRYEKAFLLHGSGGNGKSTFINMIMALIGKENAANVSLQDIEKNRFKVAQLKDKSINTFSDLPRNGLPNASNFKSIVSGDPINVEEKNKAPFDMRPFCKLIFSTNELPRSADTTDGFFRRWIILPFDKKFTTTNADPNLIGKLTTPQALSTLLNFAIEGLRRLENNGKFTESETTKKALMKYRHQTDNLLVFGNECCQLGEDQHCRMSDLYQAYQQWCKELGRWH